LAKQIDSCRHGKLLTKKLLNEPRLEEERMPRGTFGPGRGSPAFLLRLHHVFTRLSQTILYTPNHLPTFSAKVVTSPDSKPHENDSDTVEGAKETDGKGRGKKGAYPPLAIVYAKSTGSHLTFLAGHWDGSCLSPMKHRFLLERNDSFIFLNSTSGITRPYY
jgi:hypothetical protein